MLDHTQKEVKTLLHTVNNIIIGEDLHIKMERDQEKDIEILEETFVYLKIYIFEKIPPLKLHFHYLTKGDLEVLASLKMAQPSKKACEKQAFMPKTFKFNVAEPHFS